MTQDPEQDFILGLTVQIPGFGKQKDQDHLAKTVLRELETKFGKDRGIVVYQDFSQNGTEESKRVFRTDRNAPER